MTKPAEWKRLSSAKKRRVIGAVALAVLAFLLWRIEVWWVSPEHRLRQFVAAWRSRDFDSMIQLANDAEIRRMRLTPMKLRRAIESASGDFGTVPYDVRPRPLNPEQSGYDRAILLHLRDHHGRVMCDSDGAPAAPALFAVNSDDGWKVAISPLLRSIAFRRKAITGLSYGNVCLACDLSPEVCNPSDGSWRSALK